jgi:mannose-6-phosphate isomerase-like protein (cupin superfamily)
VLWPDEAAEEVERAVDADCASVKPDDGVSTPDGSVSAAMPSEAAVDTPAPGTFETRPWGGFQTIEEGIGYKVKRLVVEPGARLSLQRHRFRAESWIVVSGSPRMIVSGRARRVRPRDSIAVPRGAWHRIENPGRTQAVIIEVQHGPYLGEDDIIRRHDDYGRVNPGATAVAAPRRAATARVPRADARRASR